VSLPQVPAACGTQGGYWRSGAPWRSGAALCRRHCGEKSLEPREAVRFGRGRGYWANAESTWDRQPKPRRALWSAQASSRSRRLISLSAVRSAGCLPSRMASTMSGATKARGIRWLT